MALNSTLSRSQNQLHIHISCLRPDVKATLEKNQKSFLTTWSQIPGGILGHDYYSRRITAQQLKEQNALVLLANDFPNAKDNMNEFGLAMVAMKNSTGGVDYVLLTNRFRKAIVDKGHVEDIQDHACPQLSSSLSKTNPN